MVELVTAYTTLFNFKKPLTMNHIDHILKICQSSLSKKTVDINLSAFDHTEGYTGYRIIKLLQDFTRLFSGKKNICYLEIGVFKGLTLNSVAIENPSIPCIGVDNFSQFDKDNSNKNCVIQTAKELKNDNISLIVNDFEEFLNTGDGLRKNKIGVYFFDGPHDYRSQLVGLMQAVPHLAQGAIIVVDDCNYPHVRKANKDFLKAFPAFKLVLEVLTDAHPLVHSKPMKKYKETWWNGIDVIVHDPDDRLELNFPNDFAPLKDTFLAQHPLGGVICNGIKPTASKIKPVISSIFKHSFIIIKS